VGENKRSAVRRLPKRARYDRESIYRILDEGLVCHVGFEVDGQPFVIPMAYARHGDRLILHGSVASRLMTNLGGGIEACVSVTHLDGLVLARSQFHHSMNYRSVVAFGRARLIEGDDDKRQALTRLVEHLIPGRAADSREASAEELNATDVLEFPLDDCSAKVRSGPPVDAKTDLDLETWAGVIPLAETAGIPIAASDLADGSEVPGYVSGYTRPSARTPNGEND
jgi:nitroimidazol reductase NimA-like FMN-containing flavoprotein (pyridoxamine 5'-phosphate oxidase superfamily)